MKQDGEKNKHENNHKAKSIFFNYVKKKGGKINTVVRENHLKFEQQKTLGLHAHALLWSKHEEIYGNDDSVKH